MLRGVLEGLALFLQVYSYVLLAYAIMTWILPPYNRVREIFARLAWPVKRAFQPLSDWLMRKGLMLDVSIILAFFAISILQRLIYQLMFIIR